VDGPALPPMLAEIISPELWQSIVEAIPVIISLIIIEGLLSVDNALAIAAMASHLPGKQKYWALKVGIIGAYVFRGLALLLAAYIIENPWLKLAGAAYLIHLMAHHFAARRKAGETEVNEAGEVVAKSVGRGFWATVASIELMDLSLGVDNVVAAVALSPKMWVVCTGVFIGILALRFVAGHCIKLIEKFPVLEHTAFLLIGFVGLLLVTELTFHVDITTLQKFLGIVSIIAFTIWYSKSTAVQAVTKPVNAALMLPVRAYDFVLGGIFGMLWYPFKMLFKKAHIPEPIEEVEHAVEIIHESERRDAGK
jgi:tellurite resistance protein TerC